MPKLSAKNYGRAVKAAALLRAAEKQVRILRAVAWEPSVGEDFVAAKGEVMPKVKYPAYEGTQARALITQAREGLGGEHPVMNWLLRVANKLEIATVMLENTGTPEFYTQSCLLYGTPAKVLLDGKTRTVDLARHMDDALSGLEHDKLVLGGDDETFGADEFAARLGERLAPHFGDRAPSVIVTDHLSAKALAGAKRIRVRGGAKFNPMDVFQLLQHEALVHTATALNGRAHKDFAILGAAHAGTTEIQEGLAVFAEIITGAMDPVRFKRLVDRVIAIEMSVQGADFIEVYRYFLGENEDEVQAYENTRRVFRGGVLTGGAPFTKDGVYLNGLLRVHNFMRSVIKLGRADLIRLLFVGKLDLEDVPALASLAAQGKLAPPAILPPWAKDMRFLVSYLAYSSFLNRVKLPGLQSYYQDMLADVPDIWDFVE